MTRYLTIAEVLTLYQHLMQQSGGHAGVRSAAALESALAQPRATFGAEDLYPTIGDKAAALAFSLVQNHPFIDGNKRIGHAAMEVFLIVNGYEVYADVDEQERVMLGVASGAIDRAAFAQWVHQHIRPT